MRKEGVGQLKMSKVLAHWQVNDGVGEGGRHEVRDNTELWILG